MTLQQMFYAITISDLGSMNKAAEKLFISQPQSASLRPNLTFVYSPERVGGLFPHPRVRNF